MATTSHLPRWHEILCACGSQYFEAVFTYRWHPNQGTSRGDDVIRCVVCHEPVDARKAQTLARKAQLLQEMAQIDQQLGDEEVVPAPTESASPLSTGSRRSSNG